MPLSFDPDWWTAGQPIGTFASSLDMGGPGPTGGDVQVAWVLVSEAAQLDDTSGFDTKISTAISYPAHDTVRIYGLRRGPPFTDITFTITGGPAAILAAVGAFPNGPYDQLEPFVFTPAPDGDSYKGGPGYGVGDTEAEFSPWVSLWVPTASRPTAGMLAMVTDGGSATITIDEVDGELESATAIGRDDTTGDLNIVLLAYAIDSTDDPYELLVNEGQTPDERWIAVLGGRRGGWTVGTARWAQ